MKWGRERSEKSPPAGKSRRDRRMKKALAGPAKRTAKKKPERRAMIAAARRRRLIARVRLETLTRQVDRGANRVLTRTLPRLAAAAPRVRSGAQRPGEPLPA